MVRKSRNSFADVLFMQGPLALRCAARADHLLCEQ